MFNKNRKRKERCPQKGAASTLASSTFSSVVLRPWIGFPMSSGSSQTPPSGPFLLCSCCLSLDHVSGVRSIGCDRLQHVAFLVRAESRYAVCRRILLLCHPPGDTWVCCWELCCVNCERRSTAVFWGPCFQFFCVSTQKWNCWIICLVLL